MTGHHYHGQLLVVYNSQIDSDRDPYMRKLTIMGVAIFFMNENEAYPSPDRDSSQSFCVWHDEEGQYWIDVHYHREWRRAFVEPFANFEEVFEAVKDYGFEEPPKN